MSRTAYAICPVCAAYVARRNAVISLAIAFEALIRGVLPEVVAHEFLFGVHERHLGGGCLSTRRRTPNQEDEDGSGTIHVHRICNGCGADMGDVNEAELDAAVAGQPLPDVRLECGCLPLGDAA